MHALDIIPPLIVSPFDLKHGSFNPELLLEHTWNAKGLNVKHFDRVMFTCAKKDDTTCWRVAEGEVPWCGRFIEGMSF